MCLRTSASVPGYRKLTSRNSMAAPIFAGMVSRYWAEAGALISVSHSYCFIMSTLLES